MDMKSRILQQVAVATVVAFVGLAPATGATVGDAPALNFAAPLAEVAASYVTTRVTTEHGHDHGAAPAAAVEWRFFRETDRVEVENVGSRVGEVWQRDGNTQFFFKVFHDDRRAIEYRMDDLALVGASLSWNQHALLIDPGTLQALQVQAAGWRDGYPFRHLRGTVGGEKLDVVWRVDLDLPVVVERERGAYRERTELKEVHALRASPWPRRDPFVIRVQAQLPGGDVHRH
jgi:hypothetical protein